MNDRSSSSLLISSQKIFYTSAENKIKHCIRYSFLFRNGYVVKWLAHWTSYPGVAGSIPRLNIHLSYMYKPFSCHFEHHVRKMGRFKTGDPVYPTYPESILWAR